MIRSGHQEEVRIAAFHNGPETASNIQALESGRLRALIFDVDGTLYRQPPVRRAVLYRLLRSYLKNPSQGLLAIRAIRSYRKAQEAMRDAETGHDDLAQTQVKLACEWTGIAEETLKASVARWMEQEPLDLLAHSLREGLTELLRAARKSGLLLGVFSDYPADGKLEAIGLADFFDVAVSAQDVEVQRFKPHPRGLEVTLERLGVEKGEALYIGDRPEVDAVAASRAGIQAVIIGGRRSARDDSWMSVSDYKELAGALHLLRSD